MPIVSGLLDLLAPARCVVCGCVLEASPSPLCSNCERRLPWWRLADGCPRCGIWMPLGDDAEPGLFEPGSEGCPGCLASGSALHACYALLRYEGRARIWIPAFKRPSGSFGPGRPVVLAIEFLAEELARQLASRVTSRPDWIAPIPLHRRRRSRRGFNHAATIAHRVARVLERPCRLHALSRLRPTQPQASLRGARRRENVRGAFRASERLARGARVWLVDDVLTTGATLESAAESLLVAGAEEVRALTLAATLPPRRRLASRQHTHAATGV